MKLDFSKGLLPAIAQDAASKEVLMLGFVDEEAVRLTLETGYAHYYSRSKERIWKKGEESGHLQKIVDVLVDCDNDTLLYMVEQIGVACHTGARSCFFTTLFSGERVLEQEIDTSEVYGAIDTLFHEIESKKFGDPEKSYTAKLFSKGENTICKKIAEEAAELCFAIKDKNRDEVIYEAADLVYHSLVGLSFSGVNPDLVKREIRRRFGISGIEEKNSRGK
ncbi:MAG: bifunctional phosphoribosyl-AMP cyclohydrolase/phosphoribosyl-ATP diphosphatase HisIE [Campylobacteraceae bacterium]|jgi:phosphoribosyl-ATP pyrophosphohydrolase/phosphoribosyl-AMP cyclohydrolase|nr:bifunctional phosphoribosyl-AMP cyclohydrolase/phosphoribosyl-ATP diphosphatase HisIE [Campylobacteraceae bacterium]